MDLNSMQDLQRLVVAGFADWKAFGAVYTKRMDDLILFNYTPEAVINNQWTWLEQVSRGLILNTKTGEIVARPFNKFWNWLEGGRMPAPGSQIKTITQKEGGSLGILFRHEGEYRIATRGSFESDQAIWATGYLNQQWPHLHRSISNEWTLLFEIIYPDNRIVVDYGNRHDLVLLAIRNRWTGDYLPYQDVQAVASALEMNTAHVYSFADMEAMLKSTSTIEHEGYVVEFSDGSRFKIKGEKYRALHRIISHISYNAVLDAMLVNGWREYRMGIPEEFWDEVDGYHAEIMTVIDQAHAQVTASMPDDLIASFATRKEMALWVQQQSRELWPFFFKKYDGQYDRALLFKLVERRSAKTRVDRGEV